MASETQCGTYEVPVAPTPTNEAPQMAATDTNVAASNLPPIEAEGETIGKVVESLLLSWGIDKIFTLTVDNAASNSGTITYLDKITKEWGASILGGEFMHMRCCAHIVNLIVMEGLKSHHESIVKVRNAVRITKEWGASILGGEFMHMRCCAHIVNLIVMEGLKSLHESIVKVRNAVSSLYVTSNVFFHELCVMKTELINLCESEDPLLSMMARDMHEKFDKYWGDIEKLNLMKFVAINWLRAIDIIDLQESMEEVESYEGFESEFASQSTITVEKED
ncbi:zinc finger BED domain-containing protein RICESLEEPER 3-like [Quercus lobata]|uniref:zinc finger BED domain-containing protein RICESLEEPER 3-like n=1 Tax=Quercus lobata TaxID=97700 RepID=UPI0012459239|nr:zinc finger BED domain-containing protein RICESLEEPER 3-like [Quercus lobata]